MQKINRVKRIILIGIRILVTLWLSRRPDVVDKLILIGHRLAERKRGSRC